MAEARFAVLRAGPHVSVQDAGRRGLLRYGVPASGPMDRFAFQAANVALGNPEDAPAIEVSLGGLTLECTAGEISFAVAGGGFAVDAGGRTGGSWLVAGLSAGERLTIRPGPWGCWTYLAFAGDLRADRWLGSAATHGGSGLGGGAVRAGTALVIERPALREARHGAIPCPVWARPRHRVHVVPGPQQRFFGAQAMETLLSAPFRVTDAADRMGVRLAGPSLAPEAALTMPSEAVVRGSVQVAGDGVATVLLADHQTTGGYPKIATILSDDLDGFVQLRSQSHVVFDAISAERAVEMARTRRRQADRYLTTLG